VRDSINSRLSALIHQMFTDALSGTIRPETPPQYGPVPPPPLPEFQEASQYRDPPGRNHTGAIRRWDLDVTGDGYGGGEEITCKEAPDGPWVLWSEVSHLVKGGTS
jgi:hypothetical protein